MLQIDDLKPGDWVLITECIEKVTGTLTSEAALLENRTCFYTVNGKPIQIKAINLPFVVVTDGRVRYTIDSRWVKFVRCSKAYLKELNQGKSPDSSSETLKGYSMPEASLLEPERDKTIKCPVCRRIAKFTNNLRQASLACDHCEYSVDFTDIMKKKKLL